SSWLRFSTCPAINPELDYASLRQSASLLDWFPEAASKCFGICLALSGLERTSAHAIPGAVSAPGLARELSAQAFVEDVFQHFLPAAGVRPCFTIFQHVGFQFLQAELSFFDLPSEIRIPGRIPILDEVGQSAVLAN